MYGERHFTYHLNQDELHKVWTVSSKPWGYQACIWWPYLRCVKWKECPFFCPEEIVHGYRQCTNPLFLITTPVKEENSCFVNAQKYLPYKCQDSKETHTDPTSHAEEKKSVSTFNGQMNFLLLMKKKHLPTNQDPSYKDNNLVEQMAVDIRLYTKWWRSQKPFLYYYYFLCVQ